MANIVNVSSKRRSETMGVDRDAFTQKYGRGLGGNTIIGPGK